MLNDAFWRYLKQCFGSWNCWENVESEDANWGILTLFVRMFFLLWNCREIFTKTLNGAIWRNLKRCFPFSILWLSVYIIMFEPPTSKFVLLFFALKSDLFLGLSIQKLTWTSKRVCHATRLCVIKFADQHPSSNDLYVLYKCYNYRDLCNQFSPKKHKLKWREKKL